MKGERFTDRQIPQKVSSQLYNEYDFVPSFTLATGINDYDLKSQQVSSFKNVKRSWLCLIWTTEDISVKFNSTSNPSIPIPATESPFEFRDIIEISNIYISNNSGNTANIKIMGV